MQPNFTLKKFAFSGLQILAVLLLIGLTTQTTLAQNKNNNQFGKRVIKNQHEAELVQKKKALVNGQAQQRVYAPSLGPAPASAMPHQTSANLIQSANPLSRAFPYTTDGFGDFQLNSQFLSNTVLTPLGATVTYGFQGATAWNTQNDKLYSIDQASPFGLYTLDTLTGARTFVVNCTGVPHANFTGLTWDPFTNTMYGVSSDISTSQIFTVNITTGVCTPIGSPTSVIPGAIMVNSAPGGSLFSVDIVNDNLVKWNKTTGAATIVGPLGMDANFGQDGHFDFSDGQYYWGRVAAGVNELRVIDTTNGSSSLVDVYPGDQVTGIGIMSAPLIPCSGTPDPGNTVSSEATVCATVPFTLSLQNLITAGDITFQWQSASSTSGPWADIPGAVGQTYNATQTVATAYQCIVTCTNSSSSATSTPLLVDMTPPSGCYCDAGATSTSFEKIDNVKFGTIDNPSSSNGGYENFLTISTDVVKGMTLPITVESGDSYSGDQLLVWIDFNKNGSFSDPGELVYSSPASGSAGPYNGSITIDPAAVTGSTRMRIRLVDMIFGTTNNTPCGNSTYGQVEDYTVNIMPCTPLTITTNPGNKSITCGENTSFTVGTSGNMASVQWQYRANSSSPWMLLSDGGIYSGSNTATLTLSDVSADYDGYQYQAILLGICSGVELTTPPSTLTVNAIVPVVVPPSATICIGTIQKLTLTNTLGNSTSYSEGFAAAIPPLPSGWASQNNSNPIGSTDWFQGNDGVFPAHSGASTSYIGANYNNCGAGSPNTISNWLFMPTTMLKNGDKLTFWSRSTGGGFADRVEVRLSENGASTSVGATESSVGDYTNLLFTINPTLDPSGYPDVWTQYTATVSGLAAPVMGRLAFRYYVTDAGPLGSNSDYIGIDDVKYVATGGAAQGIWTGPAGTMFTDATATTAYTGTPATTIYVQPTVSSNYQVMFTTSTPCTSATTTVPVNVVEPVTNIANPSDDAACVGTAASFSSNSADGGPYTRQWEVSTDGGLTWSNVSGANGTTLTVSDVEESMNNYLYRCRYDAPPCAGSAYSNAAKLTVNPLPVVTLTASDLELTPGQTSTITGISSPAAISWSWTLDGSPISGGSNTQVADIDLIGTYQATVVDNQTPGCTGVSNELTIGTEASDRLWIYPNPTTGEFQVRLYSNLAISEKRKVTIFNSIGQEIMSKTFSLINTTPHYLKMDFDLSNMAKGVYVVKVAHEYTKKIVSGLVVVQ